jgi:anti-sigma regulatory factor (Ser/Thr protein kinase)
MTTSGYVHEALTYDGTSDFVDRLLPFIHEGLAADEAVLAVVPPTKIELLRDALGSDADEVGFTDMAEVGRNPARILDVWDRFIDLHPARSLRGIGEPAFAGRSDLELDECHRHEALLNLSIDASLPFWLVCPYDTATLDDDSLERVQRTHSHLGNGRRSRSREPFDEDQLRREVLDGPQPSVPRRAHRMRIGTDAASVGAARRFTSEHLATTVDAARLEDMVLVVSELVTNALQHGTGPGELALWQDADQVVCDVRDHGRLTRHDAGSRRPADDQPGGRGLWLANQLCDLVQIRSGRGGTSVTARWSTT